MWWIVLGLAVLAGVLFFKNRLRPHEASALSAPPPMGPRAKAIDVTVRRPSLPPGRAKAIVEALKNRQEPDETWIRVEAQDGRIRMPPYTARFMSVAGETFENPDGVSRQTILQRATPGMDVWLVPEPDNTFDSNAIAVYLDYGNGSTGQIGYLPRDHGAGGDVAAGKVAVWLAKVGAPRAGAPLGAVLYAVTENG